MHSYLTEEYYGWDKLTVLCCVKLIHTHLWMFCFCGHFYFHWENCLFPKIVQMFWFYDLKIYSQSLRRANNQIDWLWNKANRFSYLFSWLSLITFSYCLVQSFILSNVTHIPILLSLLLFWDMTIPVLFRFISCHCSLPCEIISRWRWQYSWWWWPGADRKAHISHQVLINVLKYNHMHTTSMSKVSV